MTSTETSLSGIPDVPSAAGDRRRWFALAIVMTAAFMDLVDVTIVNIAIPSIRQDSGASVSHIQWITAGYALAFAAGLITGGGSVTSTGASGCSSSASAGSRSRRRCAASPRTRTCWWRPGSCREPWRR